ncbi:MAG: hypothetical protein U0360_00385 [Dehalococcoidia bacterium]
MPARDNLDAGAPALAVARLSRTFDRTWAAGAAPKFPAPAILEFLLMHAATAEVSQSLDGPSPLEMVLETLDKMASGGIYDHLGGGFARYSTDARWLVPHFEKMLYDNAQLARIYLHASQLAPTAEGRARFEAVTRETLDYLAREMLGSEGDFYSAQDADSEGVEGKFFVWTPAGGRVGPRQLRRGALQRLVRRHAYGESRGPASSRARTHAATSSARRARLPRWHSRLSSRTARARVLGLRARMLECATRRTRPGLDDKALTSWNGSALRCAPSPRQRTKCANHATSMSRSATQPSSAAGCGTTRSGTPTKTASPAWTACSRTTPTLAWLVGLYRATGDLEHLRWARQLLEVLRARFTDADTAPSSTLPSTASRCSSASSLQDGSTPSGNAAAALLAFWLGRYFDSAEYEVLARAIASAAITQLGEYPSAIGAALQVATLASASRRELAILGEPRSPAPPSRSSRPRST